MFGGYTHPGTGSGPVLVPAGTPAPAPTPIYHSIYGIPQLPMSSLVPSAYSSYFNSVATAAAASPVATLYSKPITPGTVYVSSPVSPASPIGAAALVSVSSPVSPALIAAASPYNNPIAGVLSNPVTRSLLLSPTSPLSPTYTIKNTLAPGVVTTINTNYSNPLISTFADIDNDPKARTTMINYYYYKILDKWLYDSYKHLLGYLEVKGDKVVLVKSVNDFNDKAEKDSDEVVEKKADFIGKYIMTESAVNKVLSHYTRDNNCSWFDLVKHEYVLKSTFKDALEKRLKKAIKEA